MAHTTDNIELINEYATLFLQNKEALDHSAPAIKNYRGGALENLNDNGFPGKKDEIYKYTWLSPDFRNHYKKYFVPRNITFDIGEIFQCDIPELDTNVILLVNGFYHAKGQLLTTLPNGVVFGSFAEAAKKYPEIIEKHYNKYAKNKDDSFVALNTAFAQDGVFIYVPKGVVSDKSFQIVNMLLSDEDIMVQHRNLFIFEENSDAKVLVCDHTLSPKSFLTNSVTEVYVGKGATLDLTRIQNEHNSSKQLTHSFIHQEGHSHFNSNNITLHGGLVRNNMQVVLAGEYAEAHLYGLFLLDKMQHTDNYTYIEHLSPNCSSNELYKGILDDMSTGAFNGKIYVHREAQKTNAYQRNNNILLSGDAKINSKPQLEIYADDVKCSHGATVGQLDEEALFYLRSRGIDEKESRLLLMYAFAHEIINNIKETALRERMDGLVDKRLRGELSKCNKCSMHCY